MFTPPYFVPKQMAEMCENLNDDIAEAEANGSMDPVSLATKYSLRFAEIHPFQGGNGRMRRMMLNATMFRFHRCLCADRRTRR